MRVRRMKWFMAVTVIAAVGLFGTAGADQLDLERDVQGPVGDVIAATAFETGIIRILESELCDRIAAIRDQALTQAEADIIEYGCDGEADITVRPDGASVKGSFDAFVCVNANCVTIPIAVSETGGFVSYNGSYDTGDDAPTLVTLPQICQGNICVVREPRPIKLIDTNNYYVDFFSDQNEVQIYHPFSSVPLTTDINRVCITSNNDFHSCNTALAFQP